MRIMRKLVKTILLLLLLAMVAAPVQALAAEGKGATAKISFTVHNDPGTVVIEATTEHPAGSPEPDPDAPMPNPAKINCTGLNAFEIEYAKPGTYYYKVYQEEAQDPNNTYYDPAAYLVEVFVYYNADGDLTYALAVYAYDENGNLEADKLGTGIEFTNPPPTALTVTKTAMRGDQEVQEVFAGEEITYKITVSNSGRGRAFNLVITDDLPRQEPELTVTGVNDGGVYNEAAKTVVWEIAELGPGEAVTVSFTVTVPAIEDFTTWINLVRVNYDNPPSNVDPSDPYDPNWPSAQANIFEGVPHGIIDKVQARGAGKRTKNLLRVKPGYYLTYFVTMENDGTGSLLDVTITDTIPTGLKLVADTISHGGTVDDTGLITWNLGTLAPGDSVTVSFKTKVPNVKVRTLWVNQAFGSYLDGSKDEPAGLWAALTRATLRVDLETDKVEALYEPPEDPIGVGGAPQTGDNTHLELWVALMILSLLVLVGMAVLTLHERKNQRK